MALGSKKYNTQIWKTRLWIGLILLACGLLLLSLYHRSLILKDTVDRRVEVEEEKRLLEARHQDIMQKKEYLRSEEGIEAEIRKNFDVAKEGEAVIILVEDERAATATATVTPVEVRVRPWWKFW